MAIIFIHNKLVSFDSLAGTQLEVVKMLQGAFVAQADQVRVAVALTNQASVAPNLGALVRHAWQQSANSNMSSIRALVETSPAAAVAVYPQVVEETSLIAC